ncbi:MAG: DUF6442 family protein [Gordonibacter sp.]|uniref:DUF6442 family protein n=1 Tax=Gordonibacter sp. TaxID=1968902 RepID=UPI002FC7D35E
MNKQEVLEKSREENGMLDERERRSQMKVSAQMGSWMMVVWAVLFLWDFFHGIDTSGLQALMLSTVSFMCFLNARSNWVLRKECIVGGIVGAFGAAVFLVQHLMVTL